MNLNLQEKLQYQSSEVDWCEGNFVMTKFIAEFYNTISNVLFFVIPPVLMVLFRQYAKRVTYGVHLVWFMLIIVGVGSVYFHATLSLVGQLMDEMAILWVLMVALALWFPRNFMPLYYKRNRSRFKRAMMVSAVICTALGCVMPVVNHVGLLAFSVPVTATLVVQIKRTTSDRAHWLGIRCLITWCVAIASWLLDRLACNVWTSLHFPYLHSFWHLFVFLASYQACILFAFFDAKQELPEQMPVLTYWPKWSGDMGVPYIIFKVAGFRPTGKDY